MRVMRKRFRVLLLAAIVAACAVPVGFALSLEATPVTPARTASASTSPITAVLVGGGSSTFSGVPVPDSAKLVIVGSMLFGLAAAVRKAV
jgi:ABC-type phosphate transport system substrate-binding protein